MKGSVGMRQLENVSLPDEPYHNFGALKSVKRRSS